MKLASQSQNKMPKVSVVVFDDSRPANSFSVCVTQSRTPVTKLLRVADITKDYKRYFTEFHVVNFVFVANLDIVFTCYNNKFLHNVRLTVML